MPKNSLVIFDGNALVHRAYHALPPLTSRSGEVINAVFGFSATLLKVLKDIEPEYTAVAFDKKAPTFRHLLFDDYKANRPDTPQDLVPQFEIVRDMVRAFNIPVFEFDGYEADDILGTLSNLAELKGVEVIIVTGDADAMQLVRPGVKVAYPRVGRQFSDTVLYDEARVEEKFGIKPAFIADYKALVGDVSDNIPGIPGIGPKTATRLINEYGSIDDIYKYIHKVQPEKLKKLLDQYQDIALKGKKLATIVTSMDIELDLEACRLSRYNRSQVLELFKKLEFSSLLNKLPPEDFSSGPGKSSGEKNPDHQEPPQVNYCVINSGDLLGDLVKRLDKSGRFAFDVETTGLDVEDSPVVGLSFSIAKGEAYYIPVGHVGWEQVGQLDAGEVAKKLKPVFENTAVSKIAHNAKFDIQACATMGITVCGMDFDTMIAAYLLGEKSLGLKELAFNRLGKEMTPLNQLIGSGTRRINMSQVEVSVASDYACADADITRQLAEVFGAELKEKQLLSLFNQVEMPLVPVLLEMEGAGIKLDIELLDRISTRLSGRLMELEAAIYEAAGHRFNINSPRQLGQVLFEDLKLTGGKRTKSGYSTDASVLESLKGAHPVIDLVIEFRQLMKLKTTYVDALPLMVNRRTGRLHTSFNQTRTTTGRLSSSEPNLQNIPVRGDMGREIRQAFIAPEGSILISGDYSQIDLRVLAHLSRDQVLMETFSRGEDVHTATAVRLFGVNPSEVTADMRRLAKTVNFGVIYGMSGYGLEQATELSRKEAEQFIATYFARYPGVSRYLDETRDTARRQGFVQTVLGRRRLIGEINSSNRNLREAAERMAINMPVQGTSADIIKVAMIDLHREINKQGLKSRMLLQVHDELIFEVPGDEEGVMCRLIPDLMSRAVELSVPVKVDVKKGKSWGEMEADNNA